MSALEALAANASIEISLRELGDAPASRAFLAPGRRVYVSHPPAQSWEDTLRACCALRDAQLEPVPHVPVRLLPDADRLERLLRGLVKKAGVEEVLLIAGDSTRAEGPYSTVADVLREPVFREGRLRRVSFAGHPEGHPRVPVQAIRRAEREKAAMAARLGLDATFVAQFVFEAEPLLAWAREMRASGVTARIVAGLAGPARLSTLFKYGMRCGVGPSIRALGANAASVSKLVDEERPVKMMRALAEAGGGDFDGFHFYAFGGFLRTCEWLAQVANRAAA